MHIDLYARQAARTVDNAGPCLPLQALPPPCTTHLPLGAAFTACARKQLRLAYATHLWVEPLPFGKKGMCGCYKNGATSGTWQLMDTLPPTGWSSPAGSFGLARWHALRMLRRPLRANTSAVPSNRQFLLFLTVQADIVELKPGNESRAGVQHMLGVVARAMYP